VKASLPKSPFEPVRPSADPDAQGGALRIDPAVFGSDRRGRPGLRARAAEINRSWKASDSRRANGAAQIARGRMDAHRRLAGA